MCAVYLSEQNFQIVILINKYNQQLPFVTIVWGIPTYDWAGAWWMLMSSFPPVIDESTHITFPNNTLSLCSKAKAASSVTKFGLFECHLSLDLLLKCAEIPEYTHVLVPKQQRRQRTSRQSQTELDFAIWLKLAETPKTLAYLGAELIVSFHDTRPATRSHGQPTWNSAWLDTSAISWYILSNPNPNKLVHSWFTNFNDHSWGYLGMVWAHW